MRRLMAGRLIGMAVEGVGTWLLLLIGGVPMAALLGILTGLLAFLPNIGAIISGVLIVLAGFSVSVDAGLWAIGVYFIVQTVDGYLIVPYVAKKTVDMAPGSGARRAAALRRPVRADGAGARRSDGGDDQDRARAEIGRRPGRCGGEGAGRGRARRRPSSRPWPWPSAPPAEEAAGFGFRRKPSKAGDSAAAGRRRRGRRSARAGLRRPAGRSGIGPAPGGWPRPARRWPCSCRCISLHPLHLRHARRDVEHARCRSTRVSSGRRARSAAPAWPCQTCGGTQKR